MSCARKSVIACGQGVFGGWPRCSAQVWHFPATAGGCTSLPRPGPQRLGTVRGPWILKSASNNHAGA